LQSATKDNAFVEILLKNLQPVSGDIKVEFFSKDKYKKV